MTTVSIITVYYFNIQIIICDDDNDDDDDDDDDVMMMMMMMMPFCRHVTRRELMYIIASIKPMEHCLVPFLNKCDTDNDNNISLVEWGTCLDVGHGECSSLPL